MLEWCFKKILWIVGDVNVDVDLIEIINGNVVLGERERVQDRKR